MPAMLSADALAWRSAGRMMRVMDVEVFVRTANDDAPGPALVLLHGFPSSSYDFHLCWDELARTRRVVTLDYPGYGFSDKPDALSYSLLEQADVVEVVLAELGVKRAAVIAHDMGTSVTTELLARRAQGRLGFELERLVLLNGSVYIDLAVLSLSQRLLRIPVLSKLFARLSNRRSFGAQLQRIVGRKLPERELDDMFGLIQHNGGRRLLPRLIGYVDERHRFKQRWLSPLPRLDVPTLVVWGARDPIAVMAIGDKLAATIPGAQLIRFDDLGHYLQLEDPERVLAAMAPFLAAGAAA